MSVFIYVCMAAIAVVIGMMILAFIGLFAVGLHMTDRFRVPGRRVGTDPS
jgi:hypothetical protein